MKRSSPSRLGRYEVLKELGRGAMGVVLLAKDPVIGRLVALKTFDLDANTAESDRQRIVARLRREGRSAGILSHPNIVTIHDVSEDPGGGSLFIAMEYVLGSNLKELLAGGKRLELAVVANLVEQIAGALDYAHGKGVVHRDVKPANVLMTSDGRVKLTDFGIARLNSSNVTLGNQLLGTPNYMAPEQVKSRDVDHRADIFALGVILYEMMTGRKPFEGEHLTAVTHKIVHEPYTPPSRYVSELPLGLEETLERALQKDPDLRYPSAGALVEDLREVVNAERRRTLSDTQEVSAEALELKGETPAGGAGTRRGGWLTRAGYFLEAGRRLLAVAPRWLLLLAVVAAMFTVFAGGRLWLAVGTPVAVTESLEKEDLEYVEAVRQGRRLLRIGSPEAAVEAFSSAEKLRGDRPQARELREEAERQAEVYGRLGDLEKELAKKLVEARSALEKGRFQEAKVAAEVVLEISPADRQAAELVREAELGIENRDYGRRERAAGPESAAGAVAGGAAAAGRPTLEVEFITEHPVGVLTVLVGGQRLMKEPFRFIERKGKGLLGLFRKEAYKGRIYLPPTKVSPGAQSVRISVAPRKGPVAVRVLDARFKSGSKLKLDIYFSATGKLTAKLQ